jgi:hypothetical protein
MALWVLRDALRRAVLTLWHAFLFLGLRFFPLLFFLLGGLRCFFLLEIDFAINELRFYPGFPKFKL